MWRTHGRLVGKIWRFSQTRDIVLIKGSTLFNLCRLCNCNKYKQLLSIGQICPVLFFNMSKTQYRDQNYLILLGQRLESIRVKCGKSKEDFAELCGIDTRQLRRILQAESNSSISLLKKIADNLQLTLSELLNF